MSATDGATVISPPLPAAIKELEDSVMDKIADLKRKRENSSAAPAVDGVIEPQQESDPPSKMDNLRDILEDVRIVLERYDPSPSVLNFDLPKATGRPSSEEPSTKRAKLSDAPSTISQRLQTEYYQTLRELEDDVKRAVAQLLKPLIAKEHAVQGGLYGSRSSLTIEDTRFWTETLALQKLLKGVVEREQYAVSKVMSSRSAPAGKWVDEKPAANGVTPKKEELDASDMDGGKVLTIYANAQGQKQLFSSFQRPVGMDSAHGFSQVKTEDPSSVEVTMHLRDIGLPNQISATTIPHLHIGDTTKATKARPTIGELFAAPKTMHSLKAPEPSKQVSIKDNLLSFVKQKKDKRQSDRRANYNYNETHLNVGKWIGWGETDPTLEVASPEAKRKQRDRALSMGSSRPGTSRGEKQVPTGLSDAGSSYLKEDALFKKVYSSFAPAYDDTAAQVAEETRNQLWFTKVGLRRAQRTQLIDPELLDPALTGGDLAVLGDHAEREEADFAKAVEAFEPDDLKAETPSQEEKDTTELLEEISQLIETLHSYQLIRNASIIKPSTPQAQEILKSSIGTPTAPSDAEYEVYKILRAQLTLLVANLPPYALARLDGDRLKDLNTSANILVETSDDRGIMEEDHAAKAAKQAAIAPPSRQSTSTAATQGYSTPSYSRTANITAATPAVHGIARPPATNYGTPQTYFAHNQSQSNANRNGPLQYQRTASGVSTYVGSYPTNTPRPTYTPQQPQPVSGYGASIRPGGYSGSGTGTPVAGTPSAAQQSGSTSQYLARLQAQQAQANSTAASQAKPNYSSYYAHTQAAASAPSNRPPYNGLPAAGTGASSQSPVPTAAATAAALASYSQRQAYNSASAALNAANSLGGPNALRQAAPSASASASPAIPAAKLHAGSGETSVHRSASTYSNGNGTPQAAAVSNVNGSGVQN